jgi:5-methylcytosine-specific restriction protein A
MPKIIRNSVRPKWVPEPKPFERKKASSNMDIYNSTRWRKLRIVVLNEEPLCKTCKSNGQVAAAQVVDHIIPINQGGDPFERSNLQGLCHVCHNAKSARERL